jgi:hypothetical protein
MEQLNNNNEPMQSILYQGKRIQFSKYQNPGTPSHLRAVADNYLSTKHPIGDIII